MPLVFRLMRSRPRYVRSGHSAHLRGQWANIEVIRTAFQTDGEFVAMVEFRRRFPGITDSGQAYACALNIAGMPLLPQPLATVTPLHPRKRI